MIMFDVLVVGAGHAGVEAALAAQRMGCSVALVTSRLDKISFMSCNPSIGGLGKGHIVKDIDVLGGYMGIIADKSCIQFKRLNSSKGPAVRGTRVQADKELYSKFMTDILVSAPKLKLIESEVKSLILQNNICTGVVLFDGSTIDAQTVIITTGTFLRGVMFIGQTMIDGGRVDEKSSIGISDQLREFGFSVLRLKTGTPARLDKNTINWDRTIPQYGDSVVIPFSYSSERKFSLPQVACYLSHTTEKTHDIIRNNLHLSAMYSGMIEGVGPRYCPSIEDKITRFSDKNSHLTFLEPEGLNTNSIYLQGISTSLPENIQYDFLRTIPGLESVKMLRPGYAVEYDFIEPTQIFHTLETRQIKNLFLAGQINGTSGYEEAACQGLIAGINAASKCLNKPELILGRHQSYIGVLIDDLVTKGTKEPYRMFTSRAEHRMVLREDNAIERLHEIAIEYNLLSESRRRIAENLICDRQTLYSKLIDKKIGPTEENLEKLDSINTSSIKKQISLADLLRRDEISFSMLSNFGITEVNSDVFEPVEISIKYEGYIRRQNEIISATKKLEQMKLPSDFDYQSVRGLSNEEVDKLDVIRPISIAQAQRISGITPSAIQNILIHLKIIGKKQNLSANQPNINKTTQNNHG